MYTMMSFIQDTLEDLYWYDWRALRIRKYIKSLGFPISAGSPENKRQGITNDLLQLNYSWRGRLSSSGINVLCEMFVAIRFRSAIFFLFVVSFYDVKDVVPPFRPAGHRPLSTDQSLWKRQVVCVYNDSFHVT